MTLSEVVDSVFMSYWPALLAGVLGIGLALFGQTYKEAENSDAMTAPRRILHRKITSVGWCALALFVMAFASETYRHYLLDKQANESAAAQRKQIAESITWWRQAAIRQARREWEQEQERAKLLPIAPPSGEAHLFQRTTELRWEKVPGADHYAVQVQYQSPNDQRWHQLRTQTVSKPQYTFEFVGKQSGRWRVSAYRSSGEGSEWSEWKTFSWPF